MSAWSKKSMPASRAVRMSVRTASSSRSWMRMRPSTTLGAGRSTPVSSMVFMGPLSGRVSTAGSTLGTTHKEVQQLYILRLRIEANGYAMEHRQLEYLVTLTEERHFTRAAERCRVSQSGLSAAIRRLEQELDAKLFERTTRSVEPTPAALALLPHAREILAQTTAARDAVVRASRQLAGSLRVGAEQCLGAVDVNLLLERFHRRYPGVDIQFVQAGSNQLVEQIAVSELDVAFVASADAAPAMAVAELARLPLVLLVPPGHHLAEAP